MPEYRFKLWQDGIVVAEGSGPDKDFVEGEGWHYAKMYAQDGPVQLDFNFKPAMYPEQGSGNA